MDIKNTTGEPRVSAPIACTLGSVEASGQIREWGDLQHVATDVDAHDKGVRLFFPAALAEEVEDLANRERGCCAFLSIHTTLIGEELTLDISSPNPDALPVIAALAGMPL